MENNTLEINTMAEARSISKFNYEPSNGLLDRNRFPTQPNSEEDARGQFMTLFNQIKDYLNNVVSSELESLAYLKDNIILSSNGIEIKNKLKVNGDINGNGIFDNGNAIITRQPRFHWRDNVTSGEEVRITHNLNTIEPLISWTCNTGNVIVTVKILDANTLLVGCYSSGGNNADVNINIY